MGGGNLGHRASATALVLLVLAPAAGCGGGDDDGADARRPDAAASSAGARIVQPGAPGEPSRQITAADAAAAADTPHTAADVGFMQGMIHHHAQALVMTDLAASRASGRVGLIAERIDISQKAEMDVMEKWLRKRGEEIPGVEDHAHEHGPDGELMPGMVGERELTRLAAADGKAFDALFVRAMMRHHRGALTMVASLRATPRAGSEPELDAFARHVDADQAIEISRLRDLAAALPDPPAGPVDFAGTPPRLCILA
jgi:uncharacterized protein (DUF305 family)